MDTNIENYSSEELIKIIKLEDKCDLDTLYKKITKIIYDIENSSTPNGNELKNFFANCFKKVTKSLDFVVPSYMFEELGLKEKSQDVVGINKKEKIYTESQQKFDKMVESRNYPYSVPQIIPNNAVINTTNVKYPRGEINPIRKETTKHLLTVNSKFRNDYNQLTTDFSVTLQNTYNNIVSMKLSSVEFINSYYSFSEYAGTNRLTITTYNYDLVTNAKTNVNETLVEFSEGNYNTTTIQTLLNGYFAGHPTLNIVNIQFIASKGKIYWKLNPAAPPPPPGTGHAFDLDFSHPSGRDIFKNFGWLLGFRQEKYTFLEDYNQTGTVLQEIGYNPEAFINLNGTTYYLLEVTDYNKNTAEVVKYETSKQFNYNIRDILAKIPNLSSQAEIMFEDSSDRIFKTRKYFGPIRLNKLKFRLLDENGDVVNLNNGDITISLEIESLDAPYKNMV